MIHNDMYNWVYKYDRKHRVWRAFMGELEINQFTKNELFFVMGHIGDKVTMDSTKKCQLKALSKEQRNIFLFEPE